MKRRDFFKLPALGALSAPLFGVEVRSGETEPPRRAAFPSGATGEQKLHPDWINYLPGVEYFLLGNGEIQAVIQYYPSSKGETDASFLGLTLMDPERFARKASTLLFHPERGFSRTMIGVAVDGAGHHPDAKNLASIEWSYPGGVPTVRLLWEAGALRVTEFLFLPAKGAYLIRSVRVDNTTDIPREIELATLPYPNFFLFDEILPDEKRKEIRSDGYIPMRLFSPDADCALRGRYELRIRLGKIPPGGSSTGTCVYAIRGGDTAARRDLAQGTIPLPTMPRNEFRSGDQLLDRLVRVSTHLLPAHLSAAGKRDSGIWEYNMEWVRDDSMVAVGLLHAGEFERAGILLRKLLDRSIGADGRTIEASRWAGFDYTELDQNGQVLWAAWNFVCWTGDLGFAKRYWEKLRLAAEFPLMERFRDKETGLLHNMREFWERSDGFGFTDGYEIAYQFWTAFGLEKAARLAAATGHPREALRWDREAEKLREAFLGHPRMRLAEEGHLIKRRSREGDWQRYLSPPDRASLPPGSPIATEARPSCDPDASEAYPLIHGMIDPVDPLAKGTLDWLELLWNHRWNSGGYARYDTTSEPDPPAPWPLVAAMMARAHLEARSDAPLRRSLEWLGRIAGGKSGGWFERMGPGITPPAPPVGIVGWTWAEIVGLAVHHCLGVRPGIGDLTLRPRLPGFLEGAEASIRIRNARVTLRVERSPAGNACAVNGRAYPFEGGAVRIPWPPDKAVIILRIGS